jgi:hypothetical protein
MQIAKIVSSVSHNHYRAKVLDTFDISPPPTLTDYGYSQFVTLSLNAPGQIIGVIVDTALVNSQPLDRQWRAAHDTTLEKIFSPDNLPTQGVLVDILVLGTLLTNSSTGVSYGDQTPPSITLPVHTVVKTVSDADIESFHYNQQRQWQLNYYGYVLQSCPYQGETLLLRIVERLQGYASAPVQRQLRLLRQNLQWQQTWAPTRRTS